MKKNDRVWKIEKGGGGGREINSEEVRGRGKWWIEGGRK